MGIAKACEPLHCCDTGSRMIQGSAQLSDSMQVQCSQHSDTSGGSSVGFGCQGFHSDDSPPCVAVCVCEVCNAALAHSSGSWARELSRLLRYIVNWPFMVLP
jgi:hypothetical protein